MGIGKDAAGKGAHDIREKKTKMKKKRREKKRRLSSRPLRRFSYLLSRITRLTWSESFL